MSRNTGRSVTKVHELERNSQTLQYVLDILVMEDKFQNRGMFLFQLSHGSYAVDQRSGDGRISGRSYDVAVNWGASIPEF